MGPQLPLDGPHQAGHDTVSRLFSFPKGDVRHPLFRVFSKTSRPGCPIESLTDSLTERIHQPPAAGESATPLTPSKSTSPACPTQSSGPVQPLEKLRSALPSKRIPSTSPAQMSILTGSDLSKVTQADKSTRDVGRKCVCLSSEDRAMGGGRTWYGDPCRFWLCAVEHWDS